MKKIQEIVEWYKDEGCMSNDINGLLVKQGELAAYSFYLAEYIGSKHTDFITKEHNRKVAFNGDMQARINSGNPKGASEVASFLVTAKDRIEEKKAEILYVDSKLQLGQVNKILEAFTMRISFLKKEQEQSRQQV